MSYDVSGLRVELRRSGPLVLDFIDMSTPTDSGPVPDVSGFQMRLDLRGTNPPVWGGLELAGDLTLSQVHEVIQAAMGWTDSHLHRFRTGRDHQSAYFVTTIDIEEGEDGVREDATRLDQLVATEGDRLWYQCDFGDDWDHVLSVENVLDEPATPARCTGGNGACPPEDCGGIGNFEQLATWARSGYDHALVPEFFDDADEAHDGLPQSWQPDQLDLERVKAAVSVVVANW